MTLANGDLLPHQFTTDPRAITRDLKSISLAVVMESGIEFGWIGISRVCLSGEAEILILAGLVGIQRLRRLHSSGSSGRVGGGRGLRNMKSIRPYSAAILFMTYFYRRGGVMAPLGPLDPLLLHLSVVGVCLPSGFPVIFPSRNSLAFPVFLLFFPVFKFFPRPRSTNLMYLLFQIIFFLITHLQIQGGFIFIQFSARILSNNTQAHRIPPPPKVLEILDPPL